MALTYSPIMVCFSGEYSGGSNGTYSKTEGRVQNRGGWEI
jgi:hypothetical protein